MLILACLVAGCSSVGVKAPSTVEVQAKEKDFLSGKWVNGKPGHFEVTRSWWKSFDDPQLNKLIDLAFQNNSDIQIMATRVREAKLRVENKGLDRIPKLNMEASSQSSGGSNRQWSTEYRAGGNLSWEIDLWGRLKDSHEAEKATAQASESEWRGAHLLLLTELTRSYFRLRALDEQIYIHDKSVTRVASNYRILKLQHKGGLVSEAKLQQQQAEALDLKKQLLDLARQRRNEEINLAGIIGELPGKFTIEAKRMTISLKCPSTRGSISASLLQRRPDVVTQLLRIRSAYYTSRSAHAGLMPRVTLGLNGSLTQAATGGPGTWAATILPKIDFPALNPQNFTNYEMTKVRFERSKLMYVKVLRKAIGEVEKALNNLQERAKVLTSEREILALRTKVHKAELVRLNAGEISQLEMFESERQLLASEQKVLESYNSLLEETVKLYTALGGGW